MPGLTLIPTLGDAVAPSLETFRGNWTATPEKLGYSDPHSEDLGRWVQQSTVGSMSYVPMDQAPGSSKPANLGAQQGGWIGNGPAENVFEMRYPIAGIAELAGQTITRVRVRHGHYGGVSNAWLGVDGASPTWIEAMNGAGAWRETDLPGVTSFVKAGVNLGFSWTLSPQGQIAVAKLDFYIVDTAFPAYMKGQYVTHADKLWMSEIDKNSHEPGGAEGTWIFVPIVDLDAARASDLAALEARVTALEGGA